MAEIGIVTISFNQREFLSSAMSSVLGSDVDVEYVVVDPGSNDGSRELIADRREDLAAVIFDPDNGPADGLNKGMAKVASPIVGYLNSDDFYLPGALREVVDYFHLHPDVDVVIGHGILVDQAGRQLRRLRSTTFTPHRFARGECLVIQQSTFFRRTAFERIGGFNADNHTCWDTELVLDMARAGSSVQLLDRYWGAFRHHRDSISVSGRLKSQYHFDHLRLMAKALGRQPSAWDIRLASAGRVRKWVRHPDTLITGIQDRIHR